MDMLKPIRLTKQGYDDFQAERQKLRKEREHAVADLKTAREMGDLSENAAYKVARSRLSSIDSRLRHVERILRRVEIIKRSSSETVDIGAEVILGSPEGELQITLVDGYESDMNKGKISVHSPIGKAIRGRTKGENVIIKTPGGMTEYKILSVK